MYEVCMEEYTYLVGMYVYHGISSLAEVRIDPCPSMFSLQGPPTRKAVMYLDTYYIHTYICTYSMYLQYNMYLHQYVPPYIPVPSVP